MDANTVLMVSAIIFTVLAIIAFVVYQQKARVSVKGPFGTGIDVDASNESTPPTPALKAEGITSREGGMTATDETGRGLEAKNVNASKDVTLKTTGPKADPPA